MRELPGDGGLERLLINLKQLRPSLNADMAMTNIMVARKEIAKRVGKVVKLCDSLKAQSLVKAGTLHSCL